MTPTSFLHSKPRLHELAAKRLAQQSLFAVEAS